VRASRLVQLLLLLQARGSMTAPALARELEVSVRTIYRDLEALSGAGVPVYSEPGRYGGARLVDGYRTRLTGLTADEADAVLLAGIPGPAAELGLGTLLAAAQLKVLAALPPELRSRATRVRERFHLDAPGWFHRDEEAVHLATVAAALWDDRRLKIRYRRGSSHDGAARKAVSAVNRTVDPLGLVLKAGTWYLAARTDGDARTYRVSRIEAAEVLDERFERPEGFDLGAHWEAASRSFERSMLRCGARVRVRADRVELLRWVLDARSAADALADAETAEPDADGWVELRFKGESVDILAVDLLRMGADIEVLEPPELRASIAASVAAMAELYDVRSSAPDMASTSRLAIAT
jgi:predicted DNA-binding transcriptional regulator YafY